MGGSAGQKFAEILDRDKLDKIRFRNIDLEAVFDLCDKVYDQK